MQCGSEAAYHWAKAACVSIDNATCDGRDAPTLDVDESFNVSKVNEDNVT